MKTISLKKETLSSVNSSIDSFSMHKQSSLKRTDKEFQKDRRNTGLIGSTLRELHKTIKDTRWFDWG
jgi:hypothetical protein